jgi:LAO/AO transport system kinase
MGDHLSRNRAIGRIKKRRERNISPETLYARIRSGDREGLSEAITIVERTLPEARGFAADLLSLCLHNTVHSRRIGITGVPGVGKSTFIECFGQSLIAAGHRVAVLAIDPSSTRTKGSILGDKTRMNELARNPNAFIRPSAASDTLGGVARATRESIMLCEAAGFDTIIVETVGVGQSETSVHGMVDFFLLLMLAGAGDELQGIKRGIMEMADAIFITKADGSNEAAAKRAANQYAAALHLFPPSETGWVPQVHTSSALNKTGFDTLHNTLSEFFELVETSGRKAENRIRQDLLWLDEALRHELLDRVENNPALNAEMALVRSQVMQRQVSPFAAAAQFINRLMQGGPLQ